MKLEIEVKWIDRLIAWFRQVTSQGACRHPRRFIHLERRNVEGRTRWVELCVRCEAFRPVDLPNRIPPAESNDESEHGHVAL